MGLLPSLSSHIILGQLCMGREYTSLKKCLFKGSSKRY